LVDHESSLSRHWNWSKQLGLQWEWVSGNPELSRADPATIPSKATVAYQCLVSTFVAETGFYFAHRLLHSSRLYYWHKRHHEYKDSTVYATFYVGLLDAILTDFIPAGFGIVFFEMHQWTVWFVTWENNQNHADACRTVASRQASPRPEYVHDPGTKLKVSPGLFLCFASGLV
jgi:sterol desaturase/sphingolipid hydroxylase (fatty acid hydroxylase superfamily)